MVKAASADPRHDRQALTRRVVRVFLPLILLLLVINSALLVSGVRQAHLQIEQTMLHSLRILRETTVIVEDAFNEEMEDGLRIFLAEYRAQGDDVELIDLTDLQHRMGNRVDVYAIDTSGVVRHSTLAQDIGLDFRQWPDFHAYLEEIRQSGELRIDSISKESKTGFFRKYGYVATPDKRWLLELGIKLEILAESLAPFDPVLIARQLVKDHPHLNQLRIIDRHGWQLSMTQPEQVEPEVFERVLHVLDTRQAQSYLQWNRSLRYLPMPDSVGEYSFGLRMQVAEFDYNLNRILLGVGANLLIAIAAIALILRLSAGMRQTETGLHAAREALEAANRKLTELSATDGLTGIANRRRFDEFAAVEWARALRDRKPLAVLMLDVDQFKAYNDNYGHLAGDEALKHVAGILQNKVRRPGDLVARYGGEEFVAMLAGTTPDAALDVAENIRTQVVALALPHQYSSHGVLSVSIGVAVLVSDSHTSLEALLEAADNALYKAKTRGRNRVELV